MVRYGDHSIFAGNDGLMHLKKIDHAKQTRIIVWQNIILAFIIKGIFITLGAVGLATMWEAVFADMGTALIAVANATRLTGKGVINSV